MKAISAACVVLALGFQSCATVYQKVGYYEAKSRPGDCDFTVYTKAIEQPYHELGSIQFYTGMFNSAHTVEGVKKTAQQYVCQAGGNGLILSDVNEDGVYRQGTVVATGDTPVTIMEKK
jgi:hypothetical protein